MSCRRFLFLVLEISPDLSRGIWSVPAVIGQESDTLFLYECARRVRREGVLPMMKRFLSALLCACVLISMTGCAQDQEAPEDLLYSSAPIQFNSDSSSEEESSSEPEESQAENSSSRGR